MVAKTKKAKSKTATVKSKKTAPATKTPAKRGPGRPKGSTSKTKTVNKPTAKTTSKKTQSKKAAPKPPVREINEATGFVEGTDQDLIATALLEGGESRAAIVEALENTLDPETRNGTPKQITNMVSGVLNKMLAQGYTIESSFQVVEPTPASKRAATRAANAAAKKPAAKKSAAKKTNSKRKK